MLAVILENDPHSQETLASFLKDLGFLQVLFATNVDEAVFYFEQEKEKIQLIVSSDLANQGFDLPISRLVLAKPELHLCPLLVISDEWHTHAFSVFQNRFSRVDDLLPRPFNREKLAESIGRAHARRARYRDTLVYVGKTAPESLPEIIFSSESDTQWRKYLHISNVDELKALLAGPHFPIGGFLVNPREIEDSQIQEIRKFKRTPSGQSVPLAIWGQSVEEILPFRTWAELMVSSETSLDEILISLSHRSTQHWTFVRSLSRVRQWLKIGEKKRAKKILKQLLKQDERRWEALELYGNLTGEAESIHRALKSQPCSPFAYLSLLALVKSPAETDLILDRALQYCPNHPQLRSMKKADVA